MRLIMSPVEFQREEDIKAVYKRICNLTPKKAYEFVNGVRYLILGQGSSFSADQLEAVRELLKVINFLAVGNKLEKGSKKDEARSNYSWASRNREDDDSFEDR
jgi:hypothetical protein